MRESLNYSLTIDHNYIYGGFFVNIICVFKSIYLTTLFLKSYLILHVLMFSQNFVDGTHTPWNLSNEFYKTNMCCFFCVFSKQFLKLQMHACLIYFLRKKIIGKNYLPGGTMRDVENIQFLRHYQTLHVFMNVYLLFLTISLKTTFHYKYTLNIHFYGFYLKKKILKSK